MLTMHWTLSAQGHLTAHWENDERGHGDGAFVPACGPTTADPQGTRRPPLILKLLVTALSLLMLPLLGKGGPA